MISGSFRAGTVKAAGLDFSYLEMGDGPLALCMHGFPDSPMTWRFLLPALAAAGYRAVAPYARGYAPTSVSDSGDYFGGTLAADINALHEALGGDSASILIGHDWGAIAAYGAAVMAPERWSCCITLSVPPLPVFGQVAFSYEQIKRSFYFWFFQMKIAPVVVANNNYAFIEKIWSDWSPGYDATDDLVYVKKCIGSADNLEAAIGYYRCNVAPEKFGIINNSLPRLTQPLLYLHGEHDGCISISEELVQSVPAYGGAGSKAIYIQEAGHFIAVEKPEIVNSIIIEFIKSSF